ncbi:MAG: hypothetical protein DI498_10830 [Paracoccus denitrificans]|nr:MAG: hypothetical protein DI498_10830 [Paracoccus denitrificans]PZO83637.1 MAG: hypothetical protein DI633_10830 [Paracoccus denitrificans]
MSYVLLHVCLSRAVVDDPAGRWERHPLSFYVAIAGMDSPENCLDDFIGEGEAKLTGWRIFSEPSLEPATNDYVQEVTGFQPIVLTAEAVAFARSISTERFRIAAEGPEVWSGYGKVPQELFDLLADPRVPNSAHAGKAD